MQCTIDNFVDSLTGPQNQSDNHHILFPGSTKSRIVGDRKNTDKKIFEKYWNISHVANCAWIFSKLKIQKYEKQYICKTLEYLLCYQLCLHSCCLQLSWTPKIPNKYKFIFLFLILVQIFWFSMLWTNAIVVTNYQSCHEELAMITFNNLHLPPPLPPPSPPPPKAPHLPAAD